MASATSNGLAILSVDGSRFLTRDPAQLAVIIPFHDAQLKLHEDHALTLAYTASETSKAVISFYHCGVCRDGRGVS